ncbi:hypothetical protein R3P38DRAFT_2851682 [Favolaschia claudopus]|uniref:Uncharacterized protein n=1 Tax=Favolaschia claudopus TaxID=2862362 RepID=A0AAW0DSW6_9AGAR
MATAHSATKPRQPNPQNYAPRTASQIQFQYKWKTFRVPPKIFSDSKDFPYHLELQQDYYSVRFLEFRSFYDPPPDIGNSGDIWLKVSPPYSLFALNARKEWIKWSGPGPALAKENMISHPYLPAYSLWCTVKQAGWYHQDKLDRDWTQDKLGARQKLGGIVSVEGLLDPSVGVRLILVQEEAERQKGDLLKLALGQLSTSSSIPSVHEPLIATLSCGIDDLLAERKRLSQELSEVQERAAKAEQQLVGLDAIQPSIATASHLDILFWPASGIQVKYCRLCLIALSTIHDEDITTTLINHALGTHPDEYKVLAGISKKELEWYRQELK